MMQLWSSALGTVVWGTLLIGLSACGGEKPVDPVPSEIPTRLDVVSGNRQNAVVGTQLPDPLVVRVLSDKGRPVRDQLVNFRVTVGGGSVFAGSAITNADGIAQERWTLGTVARDTQQVEARAVDSRTGAPIVFATFKAVGSPGIATELRKAGGDGQPGTVGQPLPDSLVVRLVDAYGNGIEGGTVTWSAVHGTMSASTTTTDTAGRARVRLTLGASVGPQQATASTGTLTAVTFAANARGGAPASIAKMSIDAGEYTVGTSVGDSVAVRVTDFYGNPSAGATVTFDITAGNGNLSPTTVTANADGIAKTRWVLGTIAGANALRVVAAPGVETQFTATGRAGAPASITKRTTDLAAATVGSVAAPAPSVLVHDAYANPVPGASVSFSVTSGGGVVTGFAQTTDASGIATVGSWTFGNAAGTNTLSATVAGLTPVTFTTTATVGPLASLTIVSGDDQRAPVGTQLAAPLIVAAADQHGNALTGVQVAWAVTAGGGSLSATTSTTDAQGRASVYWSVGSTPGDNEVSATAESLPAVNFSATGTVGAAVSLTIVAGNGTSGEVGTALPEQLVVIARDGAGAAVPGITVTWGASGGSVSPASSLTGADGIARTTYTLGPVAGSQGATASVDGLPTVTFGFTAAAGAAAAVSIAAHPETLYVGSSAQLVATVVDRYGNARPDAISWSLTRFSDLVVTVSSTGLVTATAEGFPRVIATSGTLSDTTRFVVIEPVTAVGVTLNRDRIHVGDTTLAKVTMSSRTGQVYRPYTLRSADTTIAVVDQDGVVTARRLGRVSIIATSEGKSGAATLDVVPYGARTVTIGVDSLTLHAGDTYQLTATAVDSSGQVITDRTVTWYAPNNTIADVSASGVVSAKAAGLATIRAFLDGGADTIPVRVVSSSAVARVDVTLTGDPSVYPGDSILATAVARDAGGNVIAGKTFSWSSSDPGALAVRSPGATAAYAMPLKGVTANIIATTDGVSGSATVTGYPVMTWTPMSSPTTEELRDVWGTSTTNVFAAGPFTILHYDGSSWKPMAFPAARAFIDRIWGTSATNVFARGTATSYAPDLYHYDGNSWSLVQLPALSFPMKKIWATAVNDVWAIIIDPNLGRDRIARYTGGTGWTFIDLFTRQLEDIWGTSSNDVWVTGANGATQHFRGGTTWYGVSGPDGGTGVWAGTHQVDTAWIYIEDATAGHGRLDYKYLQPDGSFGNTTIYRSTTYGRPLGVWNASPFDLYVTHNGTLHRYLGSGSPRRERAELTGRWFGVWGTGSTVFAVGDGGAIMKGTPSP